jgi:hypothetical protein
MAMNDSQLLTEAGVIKNETATGANTATRVGTMLENIVDNKINDDKISIDGTFTANSDTLIPSQKAAKTYVDGEITNVSIQVAGDITALELSVNADLATKENVANKSNGPLGTSTVLYPTESSVSTALTAKEDITNKVTTQANFITDGTSVIKYPAIKAVKDYVDGVATGLLRDNGNYDPTVTGNYPTSANTLSGGAIQKGDLWYIDTAGTMNGNAVLIGYSVRALINGAGATTDADWAIANVGLGFVPENSANKSDDSTFNSGSPSSVLFPTQAAVAGYIANNVATPTLQQVLNYNHDLLDGRNYQGTGAGNDAVGTRYSVNAFGNQAARFNSGNYINAIGDNAMGSSDLTTPNGDYINAIGYNTAYNVQGNDINAIGNNAAVNSDGNYVNAIGTGAANGNSGESVNGIGVYATYNNSGNYVDAIGYSAANGNSGSSVVAMGNQSAYGNTAPYVVAIGSSAGFSNNGLSVNAIGYNSLTGNNGDHVNAIGYEAGINNNYDYVNLFGQAAQADGPNQTVFTNGGNKQVRINYNSLTTDRKYTLPDQSGTFAMLSDIPTSTGWGLTGNAGTNENVNYIGTNDAQDLVFKANSNEFARFDVSLNNFRFGKNVILSADGVPNLQVQSNTGNGSASLYTDSVLKGNLLLTSSSGYATLAATNATAYRDIKLPDQSGNLAMSVNGVPANALGEVTIPVGISYKVYTAILITPTGAANPIVLELENTLGASVIWLNQGGDFEATASSSVFTLNKTWVQSSNYQNLGYIYNFYGYRQSSSKIIYNSFLTFNNSSSYTGGGTVFIEIRVYP